MEGHILPNHLSLQPPLGSILNAFPLNKFPTGVLHEFVIHHEKDVAASYGFISSLLSVMQQPHDFYLWIFPMGKSIIFPHGLTFLGINAHRCFFIKVKDQKEALWATEESLKCSALKAVIVHINDIDFKSSRRLQLTMEKSGTSAFLLRNQKITQKSTASICAARWCISSMPGMVEDELPGTGFPAWRVELLRVRNGKPGIWDVCWKAGHLQISEIPVFTEKRHTQYG